MLAELWKDQEIGEVFAVVGAKSGTASGGCSTPPTSVQDPTRFHYGPIDVSLLALNAAIASAPEYDVLLLMWRTGIHPSIDRILYLTCSDMSETFMVS